MLITFLEKRFDSTIFEKEPSQRITVADSDTINDDTHSKNSSQESLENSQSVDLNSLVKSSTVTAVAPVNLQQEFSANIIIPNVKIVKVSLKNCVFLKLNYSMLITFHRFRLISFGECAVLRLSVITKSFRCS